MLVQEVFLTTTSMIGSEITEKLIAKRFNAAVGQHSSQSKLQQPGMRYPHDVVNRRTVNTFNNLLDAHWVDNLADVQVNWQH